MSLSLRTPPFPLHHPQPRKPKTHLHHFPCFTTFNHRNKASRITQTAAVPIAGAGAPEDMAAEVMQRINTQLQERENAIKRSKQLLFSDLCNFLNLNPDEVKLKWVNMNPDEKLGLIKGFVSDWGCRFHPLSAKSVRDMVDEYVVEDIEEREFKDSSPSSSSDSVVILPGLNKLLFGFIPK